VVVVWVGRGFVVEVVVRGVVGVEVRVGVGYKVVDEVRMEIKIVSHWDSDKVLLCGEYESIKDCLEKNRGAYLRGAYLRGADLRGADLQGAYLRGAKNYSGHHSFFQEVTRQQKVETFTTEEWACIGQICIHSLCWDSIKKRFDKTAMSVFKKLSKVGFDEWEKVYASKEGGK
jgi:hypothetical protein